MIANLFTRNWEREFALFRNSHYRKRVLGRISVGYVLYYLLKVLPSFFARISINLFRFSDFFWGYGIRWAAYRRLCKRFGKTAVIMPGVYAESLENLSVGEKVVLHEFSYVSCGNTEIVIEDNVAIACRCTLVTNKHNYEEYSVNSNERLMGNTFKRITIQKNAWIGANVVILGGSYIGEGSVIAAGSVVNSATKAFSLYGGVPAKHIKSFNKIYVD